MQSIWKDKSQKQNFLPLQETLYVDVAIVGGGITGIMTAYLLSKSKKSIAILEAYTIGEGTTAGSTGNLYAMVDKRLHHIQSKHNDETSKAVIESRTSALDLMESLVKDHNIDCDFKRVPWYLYSETQENDDTVEKESKALTQAGLPVNTVSAVPLPFTVTSAIKVDSQAQFNPAAFVKGMAEVVKEQGCNIFTDTPVLEIDSGDEHVLKTPEGTVHAKSVILATHTPKGFFPVQASLGPYREYALAGTLKSGDYPEGIFWSTEPEHHLSVRSYIHQGQKYFLVIGEDHKVGQADDHNSYYTRLETYARSRFDLDTIHYRWSAQNFKPADGLPYIGESSTRGVYMATGFSTDGLVYGTLSAMIISDILHGIENPWAEMYSPKRFTPAASAGKFIKENLNVAAEMVKDFFSKSDDLPLNVGEGKVINYNNEKWAVYKDDTGAVYALSAVCPHLKCIVHWNNAEKTWDCPCHGTRFTSKGDVIEGPSYHPLERKYFDKH